MAAFFYPSPIMASFTPEKQIFYADKLGKMFGVEVRIPRGGCGGCSGGRCPICPLRSVSVDSRVSGFKSSEYTTVLKATSIVSAEGSLAIGSARLRYETYIPKSTDKEKCSKCSPNPCHCEGK